MLRCAPGPVPRPLLNLPLTAHRVGPAAHPLLPPTRRLLITTLCIGRALAFATTSPQSLLGGDSGAPSPPSCPAGAPSSPDCPAYDCKSPYFSSGVLGCYVRTANDIDGDGKCPEGWAATQWCATGGDTNNCDFPPGGGSRGWLYCNAKITDKAWTDTKLVVGGPTSAGCDENYVVTGLKCVAGSRSNDCATSEGTIPGPGGAWAVYYCSTTSATAPVAKSCAAPTQSPDIAWATGNAELHRPICSCDSGCGPNKFTTFDCDSQQYGGAPVTYTNSFTRQVLTNLRSGGSDPDVRVGCSTAEHTAQTCTSVNTNTDRLSNMNFYWNPIASGGSYKRTVTTSQTTEKTSIKTTAETWKNSISNSVETSFSVEGPLGDSGFIGKGGVKDTFTMTNEHSKTLTQSVSTSLTNMVQESIECGTADCNGVYYAWSVEGFMSSGGYQQVQTCLNQCVATGCHNVMPMCPTGFCADDCCATCKAGTAGNPTTYTPGGTGCAAPTCPPGYNSAAVKQSDGAWWCEAGWSNTFGQSDAEASCAGASGTWITFGDDPNYDEHDYTCSMSF